jgi:hypothetical protein
MAYLAAQANGSPMKDLEDKIMLAFYGLLNEAASAAEEGRSRPSGMGCVFIEVFVRLMC